MLASNTDRISRPILSFKAVNLTNMLNPPLPNNYIGNLSWLTPCTHNSTEKEKELPDLVRLQRENLIHFKHDFPDTLQNKGIEVILQEQKRVGELVFETGEARSPFCNITVFKELGKNNAVEAWITLEEEKMSVLENEPEFLAFTSPNPGILEAE
ncbi:hypothetical protein SLA2020_015630 [Shorea laevis]